MTTSAHTARQASTCREGILLLLGSSLTIMGSVMVAPVLPKLSAEFTASNANTHILVPLIMTAPALAIAIVAPFAGWLADKIGRKTLLILAIIAYALVGATPAILNELSTILWARLLFGCAEAAVITCCTALIADYWDGEQRMQMINRQVISIGAVGALFFVVGGLAGEAGWRQPFYLYLLPLALVPWMMKILWEPQHPHAQKIEHSTSTTYSLPTLLVGYILIFGGMILNFIVPVQTPSLLVSIGVTSTTMIGLSAGLGLIATLIGSLLWPLMRSRLGIRLCNTLLLSLIAAGLLWLGNAQNYNAVLGAVFIHGLGGGMLLPNAMTPVMNTLPPMIRGRGLGFFAGCLCLGQFSSPLFIVAMTTSGLSLRDAIHAAALLSILAALAWLFYHLISIRRVSTT